jgi:hypothetical protein
VIGYRATVFEKREKLLLDKLKKLLHNGKPQSVQKPISTAVNSTGSWGLPHNRTLKLTQFANSLLSSTQGWRRWNSEQLSFRGSSIVLVT